MFECTPKGQFLALHVDGRKVCFAENVVYKYQEAKIVAVWSVIDKAAIEAQIDRSDRTRLRGGRMVWSPTLASKKAAAQPG